MASERVGDRSAVSTLVAAADAAQRSGAPETGLSFLWSAIELSGTMPADDLIEKEATLLFLLGRAQGALDRYLELAGRAVDPPRRRRVLAKVAQTLAYVGRFDESILIYTDLLEQSADDDLLMAQLYLERSHVIWEQSGPSMALAALTPPAAVSERLPAAFASVRATYRLHSGDISGIDELRRQAIATRLGTAEVGDMSMSHNTFSSHVAACCAIEQYEEAEAFVADGVEWLMKAGAPWRTIPLRIARMAMLLHRSELLLVASEAEDLVEELDLGPLFRPYALSYLARALGLLGRLEEADAVLESSSRAGESQSRFSAIGLGMARAQGLALRGRFLEADRAYDRVDELARGAGFYEPCIHPWAAGAIEVALAMGREDKVADVVGWLEAICPTIPCQWPRMVAAGGRAGLAQLAGDAGLAEDLYRQVFQMPVVSRLDRAVIQVRYGAWLRRHRRALEARPLLGAAMATFEELGARPLASQAHAELTAAGGRRRSRQHQAGLTVRQARVAALAATGATMREIADELHVSPRTVETHLANVYLKLDVRSKAELRRRRDELGLMADSEPERA